MAFIKRFFRWCFLMVVSFDQFIGCWLRGWAYVWLNADEPNIDETISSWVGRRAVDGQRWALISEACIDFFLGDGHCRKAIGQ